MANKILIKRSSTQGGVPTTAQLDLAELAINTYDGRLFAKTNSGTPAIVDLTRNDPIRVLGDASSTYSYDQNTYTSNVTVNLNTVNGNIGSFGGKVNGVLTVPIVTVNAKGLVTEVTTTTFSADGDFGNMSVQNSDNVSITGGSIDGTEIGATTRAAGNFTDVNTTGNLVVGGNLFVQGTTTSVDSTTVSIGDKNIELSKSATNAAMSDGAGITIIGPTTPATILYASADDSWNFNKKVKAIGLEFSNATVTGNISAAGFLGTIYPTTGSGNAGIVWESDPGGGSGDHASIKYYVYGGDQRTVLEIKVEGEANTPNGPDYIRLNSVGGTTVDNTLTAGAVVVTNALSAGSISTGGTLAGGTTTLGLTSALAINATPIGNATPSSGSFTTGSFSQGLNSGANVTVATDKVILRSSNGDIITQGNIYVTQGKILVQDLEITGTTSLGSISANGVSATEVVYANGSGNLVGDATFAFNDSTKVLSLSNLLTTGFANIGGVLVVSGAATITGITTLSAAVNVTSNVTYTTNSYTTGAFTVAGDSSIAGKLQVQGAIYKAGNEVLSTVDTIDGGTF
jgi:hypothetical protein